MILWRVTGGSAKRLAAEAKNLKDNPPETGDFAEPSSDDLYLWKGFI